MVDMQLTNAKLVQRGARMVLSHGMATADAEALLIEHGSVRAAVDAHSKTSSDARP